MKPTIKQLLARIEKLEAELALLKAQPQTRHEYHYHYQQPVYQQPQPWPSPLWPTITYGVSGEAMPMIGQNIPSYEPDH